MSDKELTCVACGAAVKRDSRFCGNCGSDLHERATGGEGVATCSACGIEVSAEDKFCPACGAALETRLDETHDGHATVEPKHPSGCPDVPGVITSGSDVKPGGGASLGDAPVGVLRIVSQEDFGKEFPVDSDVIRIGKEPDADVIFCGDNYVSHAHARILVRDEGIEIEDLGSRNGTFVQVRDRHQLTNGDRILIGATVLEYRESAHPRC